MLKKHIPNFITLLNLFSGCMAIYFAMQANFEWFTYLIVLAAVFDYFDGLSARLLGVYSRMGKELDSLADVVSFGVAPGFLVMSMLIERGLPLWITFVGFIIPLFSALRLAKFNNDERQTSTFLGLPTPANAIFWAGISYGFSAFMIANLWLVFVLLAAMSLLLVSEIPMFSLKMKTLRIKSNLTQYLFLLVCVAILVFFKSKALAIIIAWYILFSIAIAIASNVKTKKSFSRN